MNVTPVIVRELRAEARNPVNYWIRVITAGLLVFAVSFFGIVGDLTTTANGKEAFQLLTGILFLAAWIIIPITISDCISRERREGTLGLLFLTPLNAREILLGKSAVNIARSLIVFLAAVPILAIPILMGGISPEDILRVTLFNGAALILGIAASLMASAVSKHRNRALIVSLCLSVAFLYAFFLLPLTFLQDLPFKLTYLFSAIFGGEVQLGRRRGLVALAQPIQTAGIIFLLSLLTLVVVILFCSARLQRSWQDKPMSARQQKVYSLFCSPRFLLSFFKRWKQRKLTRNPVGWLQRYSWSSRLSTWGWCGIIILVETALVITSNYRGLATSQSVLQYFFFVSIAFSAVNSFQRERQMGALELILVTPIREKELIMGRLRGIWEQFLPAFLVFMLSSWFMQDIYSHSYYNYWNRDGADFTWLWRIWQFLSIPVVGLYFGLRFRSMLSAWFLTCVCCLMAPGLIRFVAMRMVGFGFGTPQAFIETESMGLLHILSGLFFLALPWYAWRKTEKLLRDRSFIQDAQ